LGIELVLKDDFQFEEVSSSFDDERESIGNWKGLIVCSYKPNQENRFKVTQQAFSNVPETLQGSHLQ